MSYPPDQGGGGGGGGVVHVPQLRNIHVTTGIPQPILCIYSLNRTMQREAAARACGKVGVCLCVFAPAMAHQTM